ncbi:MAG: efflux RND transporter permease subunit [Verrucomicrobia bacterium]|nr:efflux RND transporter permease subunit [Verrucomicrobiota bacterium]
MIRWFAQNSIAANFLMLAILAGGIWVGLFRVPMEVTPALSWNTVMIEMPYRGATAKDVERAILIPVEEALEGVKGIKQLNADGSRGMARFFLDAEPGTDLRELLEDVKARVDTITTFPNETERPRVFIPESGNYFAVLKVAITGDMSAHDLRKVARRVQEDLLEMPGISRARVEGGRRLEISIEAKADKLTAYQLSFQDLADAIRRFSIDLPAGAIDSPGGTLIVRTRGQAYGESEFAKIPIRSAHGAEVLLGEVADIHDGFEEGDKRVEFDGKRALFVQVMRTGQESAIDISNKVREYVRTASARFPQGISLAVWNDESRAIRARLTTVTSNTLQGGALVLLLLGLTLRPALAFWIAVGIPVALAGGVMLMPWFGLTANMMSMFGFFIVIGIVGDDAIVTGENIYEKLKSGMKPLDAVVAGTLEVSTPVTYGALTTIVAFLPMMFFKGTWGDYARQIPPVVASVLLFSLLACKWLLPAHLKSLRVDARANAFDRMQGLVTTGLERFVNALYEPALRKAVRHRYSVLALFVMMGLLMVGYCLGGRMKFVSFPSVDSRRITAVLRLPEDTPLESTARYMDRILASLETVKREFVDPGTGESLIRHVTRVVGGSENRSSFSKSSGFVSVEILDPSERTTPGPRNSQIANRWTELIGPIPEARLFRVFSEQSFEGGREYSDANLHLELRGPTSPKKAEIAERIKKLLEDSPGIRTAWAQINYGQDELEFSLKPRAAELGLNQYLLAQQIRQAFYGEEAQRVQRGPDDIRVMVRLPKEARETLHTLDQMRIRTPRGATVPLATVAEVRFTKAPSFVERNDGAEIIRIGAQPRDEDVNVVALAKEIAPQVERMCLEGEEISFQFKGYVDEAEDSRRRTILGTAALLLAIYALLAIPLKSLSQPVFVMLVIPLGTVGALLGHLAMGMTPSYLSVFGMLALAGISVNNSLVMVDYVNQRRLAGAGLEQAAVEAGVRRFQPILLTSITTFAGLMPMIFDDSLEAQFLIPMAVSMGFGILFTTAITLFLVPCSLLAGADIKERVSAAWSWYGRPFRTHPGPDGEAGALGQAPGVRDPS